MSAINFKIVLVIQIKKLYNRTFIIEINGINNSFSYSDVITKTIIMKLL